MPSSPTEFPLVGSPPGVPRSPQTREAGKFRGVGVDGLSAVAVSGPGLEGGPVPTEDRLLHQLLLEQQRTNRYLQLLLLAVNGTNVEVSLSEVA